MKIIHVIQSIDPASGGPAQVVVRLAAAQASLGHEIHLVAYTTPPERERVERQITRVPHLNQVRMHLVELPGRLEFYFPRKIRSVMDGLLGNTDFVHLHAIWGPLLKAAADRAHRAGVPYCFRPAGMLDSWSLRQRPWKKKLVLALGLKNTLNRATFIHALNPEEIALMRPLGLLPPCVVLPNGVFLEEIDPLPERGAFRRRFPALQGRRFILFLSRLHSKKGLDYLADAFALLAGHFPDVDLVVAGPDEGAEADFRKQIEQHQLTGRVHLVGPLYGPDKFEAIVDASCFCLPSRQEGFSIAITEALGCGTPVVVSKQCNFPEVTAAQAGIETELNPPAIAGALSRLLENPELARTMGRAGRALVEDRFTWPKVAGLALDCYSRIATA